MLSIKKHITIEPQNFKNTSKHYNIPLYFKNLKIILSKKQLYIYMIAIFLS